MRLIRYSDVADVIAGANNDAERKAAADYLARYYRYGQQESVATRMRTLRLALLQAICEQYL